MSVAGDVAAGTPHHIIPDGCVSLVGIRTPGAAGRSSLVGPRVSPLVVPLHPGTEYHGVRFWPDAGPLMLGCAGRSLSGRVVAPVVQPAWAAALARRLASAAGGEAAREAADEILAEELPQVPRLDQAVRAAVLAIIASRGEMSIAELARGTGLGERQLERRFGGATGLTPKQFCRIRRMRSALAHLLEPAPRTWSEVAADLGFADHAHLVRDAVSLSGLTPSAIAGRARAIRHESVRP
jgi:transcriptional regulator GlxA family with amidase domain